MVCPIPVHGSSLTPTPVDHLRINKNYAFPVTSAPSSRPFIFDTLCSFFSPITHYISLVVSLPVSSCSPSPTPPALLSINPPGPLALWNRPATQPSPTIVGCTPSSSTHPSSHSINGNIMATNGIFRGFDLVGSAKMKGNQTTLDVCMCVCVAEGTHLYNSPGIRFL